MAAKKHTRKNVRRLKAQTTFIRVTNKFLITVILLVVSLVFCLSYLPQKMAYEKKLGELTEARAREDQAESRLDYLHVTLDAIKNDPSYLELQARDRLQLSYPNEWLFRMHP